MSRGGKFVDTRTPIGQVAEDGGAKIAGSKAPSSYIDPSVRTATEDAVEARASKDSIDFAVEVLVLR